MALYRSESCPLIVTAQDVLPAFGVAFVVDAHDRTWGISRSAEGPGLHTLEPGTRLEISLDRHDGFSLVRSYRHVG